MASLVAVAPLTVSASISQTCRNLYRLLRVMALGLKNVSVIIGNLTRVFDDVDLQLIQVNLRSVDALVVIWEELPKTWKTLGQDREKEELTKTWKTDAQNPSWML
jgi:hypothetical protein